MGLMDKIGGSLGDVLGGGQGGVKAILVQQVVSMLSKPGGLGNLTAAFQSAGLQDILQSWIGGGDNKSISAGQVRQVFGDGTIREFAGKAGIGEDETAGTLAGLLPQLVDKLSPDGKEPSSGDLGGLLGSVGKFFS